ncbi:MAG: DMT family transporter, partial [Firmicutes bacterium]|nr:DMT family transporter [Bacillota bacterium]
YANASTVGVLACTNPFFTMILARLILKEHMHPVKLTALGIALSGVMLMLRFWDLQEGNTVLGMVSIILSSVCFGLYAILSRKSVERLGMTAQTSLSFLFGSLILMLLLFITRRPVFEGAIENAPILLYTGLIVTGLGYFCYLKANELAGATQASYAFFLKPVFAPILALIILHEKLLWNTIAGTILILTASAINVLHTRKTEMRENRMKQENRSRNSGE